MRASLFPKEITLIFKDDKATFIASAGLGMVQMVNLLDYKNKQAVSLLIDNLRENVGCKLSPEDIAVNENITRYSFDEKEETKTISEKC